MIGITTRGVERWANAITLMLALTLGCGLISSDQVYAVTKAEKTAPKAKTKPSKLPHQLWGIVGVIADSSAGKEKSVVVLKNYTNHKTYTLTVGDRLPASPFTLVSAARKNVQVYDGKNYHTLNMIPPEVADESNRLVEDESGDIGSHWDESQKFGVLGANRDTYEFGEAGYGDLSQEGLINDLTGQMTESQRRFLKAYREALRAAAYKVRNLRLQEFEQTAELAPQAERAEHIPYGNEEMTFDEWTSVNGEPRESGH